MPGLFSAYFRARYPTSNPPAAKFVAQSKYEEDTEAG